MNNVRDTGENGLAGVSVELYRLNTTLVGTTLTDANGGSRSPALMPETTTRVQFADRSDLRHAERRER